MNESLHEFITCNKVKLQVVKIKYSFNPKLLNPQQEKHFLQGKKRRGEPEEKAFLFSILQSPMSACPWTHHGGVLIIFSFSWISFLNQKRSFHFHLRCWCVGCHQLPSALHSPEMFFYFFLYCNKWDSVMTDTLREVIKRFETWWASSSGAGIQSQVTLVWRVELWKENWLLLQKKGIIFNFTHTHTQFTATQRNNTHTHTVGQASQT